MTKEIRWKKGARIKGDAEAVYAELEALRAKHGGDFEAELIVEAAEQETSAMHGDFEWDDTEAAKEHRLEQARKLVRSVEVIYSEAPQAPTKAYSIVTRASAEPDAPPEKVYTSTAEALADPIMRDEILGRAINEAVSYRRKYAELQELAKVIMAVDQFLLEYRG